MNITAVDRNRRFSRILFVFSFFILGASFFPIVGSFFLMFIPLLLLFYGAVAGRTITIAAFLIPLIFIFLLSQLTEFGSPYLLVFLMGTVGLALHDLALKNSSVEKTVIYPALIIVGVICAYFFYLGWKLSVSPWAAVLHFLSHAIEQNINVYSRLPLNKEDINLIKNNKQAFVDFFAGVFPALALTGTLTIAWINMLAGRNLLRSAGIFLDNLNDLSKWKAPEYIIWIFIVSGGFLILPHEQFNFIGLNVLIVICFIYFLHGLAIISFIFQNKNVPPFFRFLVYFLIAVQQFLMIPIIAFGLFDTWFDFRKLFQTGKTESS